jgi:hypothetical protein
MHVNVDWQHLGAKCIHHYAFCNLFRYARETHQKHLDVFLGLAFEDGEIAAAETFVDGPNCRSKLLRFD